MKQEFVIRTKTPATYFRGNIRSDSTQSASKKWFVSCVSYAGGARKDSPLNLLDLRCSTKVKIVAKLRSFAKRGKYLFSFSPSKF